MIKDKIKILLVFDCFEQQGGIENFVINVMRNIDCTIYHFDFAFRKKKQGLYDEEVKQKGSNIYYFDTEKKTFANYAKSLKRIINKNGPYDVVHSHCYFFSGFVLKQAKKNGVPIRISHSHETSKGRKQTLIRKIYQFYMRKMINYYSNVRIGCSTAACNHLFGEKISSITLYNGIDLERFKYDENSRYRIRNKLNLGDNFIFLNIGRFAHQKNHRFSVEVFNYFHQKHHDSILIFIGNGELKLEIYEIVNHLNLNDYVIFLDECTNVEEYYSACDCFILPSFYEGLSLVLVEAQVNGVGCIASNYVPNEVKISSNLFFAPLDKDEWIKKMEYVYRNNKRISLSSMENSPFDIKETVRILEDIYNGHCNDCKKNIYK